jgi:hypothetical protein
VAGAGSSALPQPTIADTVMPASTTTNNAFLIFMFYLLSSPFMIPLLFIFSLPWAGNQGTVCVITK